MSDSKEIFIGDTIKEALQRIEEQSDEYYIGELQDKYATEKIDVRVEARGNYLNVTVIE